MAFEKILVVDDELVIRKSVAAHFQKKRYKVATAETIAEAEAILAKDSFDFILLDERLPDGAGSSLLSRILEAPGHHPFVVMMSAHTTVDAAIKAVKVGAFDFILKPFSISQIEIALKRAETYDHLEQVNQFFNEELNNSSASELIGNCQSMMHLKKMIRKVAATEATVLVTGENGTGKELVARELHKQSTLSKRPFIRVNCAAMSETLIESEFFGHEKGSFTGANTRRSGRFELADTGTILLDEIGELSPRIQAKLLRVLQEKEFERVGGTKTIRVKVRVIATTNRNLLESVKRGEFREDLYYRLSVFPVEVPALRDRGEDILQLTNNFLKDFSSKHSTIINGLSDETQRALMTHLWPGNVRELQNTIERAVILSESGQPLQANNLNLQIHHAIQFSNTPNFSRNDQDPNGFGTVPPIQNTATLHTNQLRNNAIHIPHPYHNGDSPSAEQVNTSNQEPAPNGFAVYEPEAKSDFNSSPTQTLASLGELERDHIFKTLGQTGGNRAQAADILQISTRTLRNKLNLYKEEGFSVDF